MENEEGQLEFQEGTPEEMPPTAEGEPAAETEEIEAAPVGEEAAEREEPPKKTAQDRIHELTGKWRSTERDRDDWRDAFFKLQQQTETKPREPEPAPIPLEPDMSDLPKPKWESFETEEDFRAAEIEWAAEKVYRKKELERQRQDYDRQVEAAKQEFRGWLGEGIKKFPDFEDVAKKDYKAGGPAITMEMDAAIRSDPLGHEIVYHLGKNREESERIARLNPIQQIREIGRLSAKLENSKPQPRTETKAPAVTRGATPGVEAPSKDPLKMSWKEYEAMRNKQLYG